MRDFLDTWAGYNALGLADAQKMALFYGEGSNGKGVWVSTKAWILGDYAWATGIETFIDAGKQRKGSDASPDLAALAGRRMVHANEPEDQSRFSDGLIKSLTSDEPKGGVRELLKPPFELIITFKNTVMANNMPKIGTDHGIQRRVQVVPWTIIIPDEEQDLRLKDKLKEEASGILNRMVAGALRYLTEGLSLPEAVKEATREYQQENDLLGRFLDLCVARVKGETVGATPFHRVFAAWQTWAGSSRSRASRGRPNISTRR
jgi:putative DNA primase/helicase